MFEGKNQKPESSQLTQAILTKENRGNETCVFLQLPAWLTDNYITLLEEYKYVGKELTPEQIALASKNLKEMQLQLPEDFHQLSNSFSWSLVGIKEVDTTRELFDSSILQKHYDNDGKLVIEDFIVDLLDPDLNATEFAGKQSIGTTSDATLKGEYEKITEKPKIWFKTRLVRDSQSGELTRGNHVFRIYNPSNYTLENKEKTTRILN